MIHNTVCGLALTVCNARCASIINPFKGNFCTLHKLIKMSVLSHYDMQRLDACIFDEAEPTTEAQATIAMHEANKNGAIAESHGITRS